MSFDLDTYDGVAAFFKYHNVTFDMWWEWVRQVDAGMMRKVWIERDYFDDVTSQAQTANRIYYTLTGYEWAHESQLSKLYRSAHTTLVEVEALLAAKKPVRARKLINKQLAWMRVPNAPKKKRKRKAS